MLAVLNVFSQADIRKVDFKNFTYPAYCASEDAENVTVKDSEFSQEKQMEGYVERFYFKIISVTYGDLNADKKDEAVILSVCNTGGTGNFSEGFIYTIKAGKTSLIGRIPGGDRAYGGLREARVENGLLVVEANDVGEMGGACCPEFVVTTKYRLANGKLFQSGAQDRRELYPSQRVTFAKGTSGTTLKLKIAAQDLKRLVVGARAGQTLTVSVGNTQASLRLLDDAIVTEGTNSFTAKLPKNGDYTIEIGNYSDTPTEVTVNIQIQ